MPEKDSQLALDYILESLKSQPRSIQLESTILLGHGTKFGGKYKDVDREAVEEELLKLFLDGWIVPKDTWLNQNWFRLSSYGELQLDKIQCEDYYPVFLDPTSTISKLKNSIPNIDHIALDYFKEALWAIQKNLYLSAAVTMGCASECSILALIDATLDYYSDPDLDRKFGKEYKIKPKFELLQKTIIDKGLKKDLLQKFLHDKEKHDEVKKLFIDFDSILAQMFQIYRLNRNDAGHPTGVEFDKDIARSEAAMFRKYCKIIYGLIKYIDEAKNL